MRMRGYDVVAKPAPFFHDVFSIEHWNEVFENALIEENLSGNGKEAIVTKMQKGGNGARAEVYVSWIEGGAHVFVAENRSGAIIFLDPQSGNLDVEYYFELVKFGETQFFRMDNLEINEIYIKECCEETE